MLNCFSTTALGFLSRAERYCGLLEANLASRSCISPRVIFMVVSPLQCAGENPGRSRCDDEDRAPTGARTRPGPAPDPHCAGLQVDAGVDLDDGVHRAVAVLAV